MDHFARPNDELAVAQAKKELQRNFQGYSTRAGADIYAFGMSAISQIPDAYWQNEKELPKYYGALDSGRAPLARGYVLSDEDKVRRETIMRVMCDLSLDYASMSQRLGVNFASHFGSEIESLAPFEADSLVRRSRTGLEVTETGRLFIRNIAMCFDNTLAPSGERKHSRTI
jgi:oxygen-independent coproporphyrinogen-3 oxidase